MQRLFSIFPSGWPGGGLLVLRIAASGFLLTQGGSRLLSGARWEAVVAPGFGIIAGLLMLIGLWSPVGCLLAVATELWLLLVCGIPAPPAILLIAICAAVEMLGPGSWSIDAVLFGRRRLDINDA